MRSLGGAENDAAQFTILALPLLTSKRELVRVGVSNLLYFSILTSST